MPEDYLSFDDALRELQMQEAELRALVSQGKIRAFRDENTLKFRRTDVDSLRKQRETQPTLVIRPTRQEEPQALADEPIDLLAGEGLDYDDTAETIIGDAGAADSGDTALDLADLEPEPVEPGTKVPTIELTPAPSKPQRPDETAVPTLELGGDRAGSDTEVPTMVLGLDDYDDTQLATEDVATEEVYIEEGDLGEGPVTADIEQPAVPKEEEREAERAIGSITASSSYGTGEPLAIREHPSPLFTVFEALAALILLIPGGIFFFCLATGQVPEWGFLQDIMKFFWEQFGVSPPAH